MKKVNEITKVRKLRIKAKNEKAITLVALAVTIIVLLILGGIAISLSIGNNGIISRGEISAEGNKLASYKEKLEMYKAERIMENENFLEETLSAGTDYLQYNTKKAEEKGTIKTIIPEFEDKYLGKLEVIKGELFLTSTDKKEVQAAKIAGIEFNPYDITEDGELQSSNTNLELMSPDGTLTIPSNVKKIGYGAFSNVEGLKTIIIPGTCKIIGEKAFANNKTLEKVIIQDGVEIIDKGAFMDCNNLTTVEMANSVTELGDLSFYFDDKLNNINLSKGLKNMGIYALHATSIEEIEIPEGIREIKNNAFSKCKKLYKVVLPESLEKIDANAFLYCNNLTNIEINENNKNFKFKNGILMNSDESEMLIILSSAINGDTFVIPDGITNIESNQLEMYSQIKNINIPSSVTKIGSEFINKNITKVNIAEENEKYETYKNGIYEKVNGIREKIIRYYGTEEVVEIEKGIKIIGSDCFNNKNITNITLPESLEEIGGTAFRITKLERLSLGKNIKKLEPTFLYFSKITELTIAEENPYYVVENDVLYSKDNKDGKKELLLIIEPIGAVTEFEIPYGVTKIGRQAFYNQNKMTKVIIPETVKEIEPNAFGYCNSLTNINIPSSVEKIGEGCFDSCKNLSEIRINKEKGSIEGSPWGADKGDRAVIWLK